MSLQIGSGFEPTKYCGSDRDVLEASGHYKRFAEDLGLVHQSGIRLLRVAVPWHRIEKVRGVYDWIWMDEYMRVMKDLGIEAIMDPLHHWSAPDRCSDGFLGDKWMVDYIEFFMACVDRYPWARKWTVINEPTVTTHFCCENGTWHPQAFGQYGVGIDKVGKVIMACADYLQQKGKEHWYVDACNPGSNPNRFTFLDEIIRLKVKIDVLGLDYYPHCDDISNPVGFYTIAKEYYERYKIPIALTETNIRGEMSDRQTWFAYMYRQCLKLEQEVPFVCFIWYPFIDSFDWCSLLQVQEGCQDPVGIMWIDEHGNRRKEGNNGSNLFDAVRHLNQGGSIDNILTFPYLPPMDETLKNFKDGL